MEIAIPLLALGSLYVATQKTNEPEAANREGFSRNDRLPNTDMPNRNYPDEYPIISADVDLTSHLSTVNKYDGPSVYTDKYFNPEGLGPSPETGKAASQYYNLTGQKVDATYFQHNNMVPFFGSNIRSRLTNDNVNEGLLDSMNGTGSQIFSKKEQAPLFSPSENLQWAYGMPSATDFVQSRMNVSTKMSNVKPFEEERVRPGLGAGEESLGYNSGMMAREMWMPKTVDQMRATNNPKAGGLSAQGYEGPAMSSITNRGLHGHVEKNRPDRFAETGADRYLATTVQGGGLGQTLNSLQVDRDATGRSTQSMSYVGGAASAQDATYVDGEYMPSHRQDLGAVPLPNVRRTDGVAREGDYSLASNKAYTNNRSTANNDDYFGAMGSAIGAVVAPLLDILRPSRKENAVGSARPYQNASTTVKNSYILNPMDRAPTTIRETTENAKEHYNINANNAQNGGGYMTAKHQSAYTTRQDTGNFEYAGIGGTVNAKQMRNYEAEYNQRNNEMKSSTIAGRMVPGNMRLHNADINQRNNKYLDADLDRRQYATAASMPYQSPSTTTMGRVAGNTGLYNGMQMDRADPMVLDSLKSNPYSHNIMGAFR